MTDNYAIKQIELAKNKLIEVFNPLAIYLFGSYAWGSPHEDSDLDLLVIVEGYDSTRYEMLVEGHKALVCLELPKDLLVYSRDEFEKKSESATTLCHKVKSKGIKIYARAA